jgi:hypothetical protein
MTDARIAGIKHQVGWGRKEAKQCSFLKKRTKKLLLLPLHGVTLNCSSLRGAKRAKVIWFFS